MSKIQPRLILGLDVSTTCIGMSLVLDDFTSDKPKLLKMTYVSPKPPKGKKGIEELFIKRDMFEEAFAKEFSNYPITDVIIEEPLTSANNLFTVATLLKFNALISDSVYRRLGVVPNFISSYDARTYSFPELVSLRKYNKKGVEYPLKHVNTAVKNGDIVLFGAYPFDIDKKTVMMDMVNMMYPDIQWLPGKKTDLRKENYDMCDSLICALAYVNLNHHGVEEPVISEYVIEDLDDGGKIVKYKTKIWDRTYEKKLIVKNQERVEKSDEPAIY